MPSGPTWAQLPSKVCPPVPPRTTTVALELPPETLRPRTVLPEPSSVRRERASPVMTMGRTTSRVAPPVAVFGCQPGWVVPSMVTALVTVGRPPLVAMFHHEKGATG